MEKRTKTLTKYSKEDIVDYIVIAMAISGLLALLLGSERVMIGALIVIALTEAIDIPNTSKNFKRKNRIKENK